MTKTAKNLRFDRDCDLFVNLNSRAGAKCVLIVKRRQKSQSYNLQIIVRITNNVKNRLQNAIFWGFLKVFAKKIYLHDL
jgi:hypothetical protein